MSTPENSLITESPRLILREFESGDAPALHPVFSHPEATHFTLRIHSDVSQTLAWVEAIRIGYEKRGFAPWAVVRKKDGILLGYCGCGIIRLDDREECEVGYRIIPSCWGQGYATEAALTCIEYMFTSFSIARLVAVIQPENVASIRVAKKTGMKYRSDTMYEGVPMKLYEISANDSD